MACSPSDNVEVDNRRALLLNLRALEKEGISRREAMENIPSGEFPTSRSPLVVDVDRISSSFKITSANPRFLSPHTMSYSSHVSTMIYLCLDTGMNTMRCEFNIVQWYFKLV